MLPLNRLDRYLLREVTWTFVAVTGVLLVVLLSNQFARVLGQAAQSDFPGGIVLALIGLTTLQQLTLLVPIGLFLGIVLALGRLYHESEMTAMTACGVGPLRIYKPIVLLSLVVAALLAALSYRVVPAAWQKSTELRVAALRAAQFGALEAGRFRSFAGGDAVFYAERISGDGELFDVFVQRSVGDRIEIAMAERAVQRGAGQADQLFILYNGRRYEGVPGAANWRIVEFREHGIAVQLPDTKTVKDRSEVKSTPALLASDEPRDRAEFAWRTAVPVMALVLMVLAVPMSRLRPRQGRFARVGLAVLAYFLYSNLLAAVRVWIQKDTPGGQLGLWWVHLVPLAIAGWLLWHEMHPGSRLSPATWPMRWRRRRAAARSAAP
ncbi:MAG TPA: LPS export ABC transporter permease LptF [Steroidobacteraceae bacterium]|nr:LPS export ABC transporter permease LptF [Steroidobacteraceae bacterium]